MEKFFNLPKEKQNTIIDAALNSFAANGYKKTSVSDIAAAAGISKAMVFHYFGTKKALYFYLVNLCGDIIINEVNKKFDNTVSDFFDRIMLATEIKVSAIKKHPAILDFLISIYFESDDEVKDELEVIFAEGKELRNKIGLDGIDFSKFKDGIDPKLIMKMLSWIGDGFARQLSGKEKHDLDNMLEEFFECIDLLRNNFYKEDYIKSDKYGIETNRFNQ